MHFLFIARRKVQRHVFSSHFVLFNYAASVRLLAAAFRLKNILFIYNQFWIESQQYLALAATQRCLSSCGWVFQSLSAAPDGNRWNENIPYCIDSFSKVFHGAVFCILKVCTLGKVNIPLQRLHPGQWLSHTLHRENVWNKRFDVSHRLRPD